MSVRFHNIDPRGMHVNTYDRGSWTALTECAHYGAHVDGKPGNADPAIPRVAPSRLRWNEELICLPLRKGAHVNNENRDGKTMLEFARKGGLCLTR